MLCACQNGKQKENCSYLCLYAIATGFLFLTVFILPKYKEK
jgi:hypothetical protein